MGANMTGVDISIQNGNMHVMEPGCVTNIILSDVWCVKIDHFTPKIIPRNLSVDARRECTDRTRYSVTINGVLKVTGLTREQVYHIENSWDDACKKRGV